MKVQPIIHAWLSGWNLLYRLPIANWRNDLEIFAYWRIHWRMIPYFMVRGLFYLPFVLAALWITSTDIPARIEVPIGVALGLAFLMILPFSVFYPAKWCLGYRNIKRPNMVVQGIAHKVSCSLPRGVQEKNSA